MLTDEPLSLEDYKHVQEVWQEFGMETLKDLCELYVKSDVLQLTVVFNKYREECLQSYGLDPLYYYTAPGKMMKNKCNSR